MRQLSGIKVFLFGFLCHVALFLFVNLFFGFEQWNREFKFIFIFLMNRIFKYLVVSIIMGVTVFYAVYYTKGEYNYMAIPTAFLINGPIYFSRKKT